MTKAYGPLVLRKLKFMGDLARSVEGDKCLHTLVVMLASKLISRQHGFPEGFHLEPECTDIGTWLNTTEDTTLISVAEYKGEQVSVEWDLDKVEDGLRRAAARGKEMLEGRS